MTDERFDVVVVGAGLAGLVAGVEAARSGARTVVLDAHPAGGRARTTDRAGYLFNEGPHALYETGPLMALLRRWGQDRAVGGRRRPSTLSSAARSTRSPRGPASWPGPRCCVHPAGSASAG